jgi:Tfp pilus assembly protein PilO
MKFRHLILLIVLTAMGFVLQQFVRYFDAWDELQVQRTALAPLAAKIENVMYEEETIKRQLAEAERLHAKLRRLLPETLGEEELVQQVEALAQKHGIKILASKTAIHSRPGYREATLDITLEAADAPAKRFMRELKSIPRRIHIVPPEKRGKKSIHLSISIYAVSKGAQATFSAPRCVDMPSGLLLPPLRDRLALRYADYIKQCNFISSYDALYLEQLRLLALQKENARLQSLERQLRRRP